jgi:iron complex outermembrane receptor protein
MTPKICGYLYLLACLSTPPAWCAARAVRGTVTDASGAAIAGARVRLQAGGRTLAETMTSGTGEFTLTPPGNWTAADPLTVSALASGFEPASTAGTLAALSAAGLTLALEIAPYRLAVEVRATAPANESTLDMSGVRESAAKDVGEALTSLDGVWKIRKAGIANDLVIRGFQQNNIAVLVDGSRTYGACPSHMDPPSQHVDFAEVDRVEVSKGAFDVENQGSLGAVVNIVTKSPGMGFGLKPSFSAGSFGYYNPSLTASWGNRAVRVLGGYSFRISDPYIDGSGRPFTGYANYSTAGKRQRSFDIHTGWIESRISLTERQEISLGYSRQQAGLILYPYLMMDSDYDHADRATFKYSARDLAWGFRSLRAEGYLTQVRHFMSDSQRASAMMGNWMMASDAATKVGGGRVEADWGRGFTVGAEAYHRNWNMLGYMRMSGTTTESPSIPDVNTQTAGAFATYRRTFADRVRLSAGARFDHAHTQVDSAQASTNLYYQFHNTRRTGNQDNYASGNVRVSVALPRAGDVFAGVGTTGRIPDAEERYFSRGMGSGATVGNPLLPVTRNTEVSAGWNLSRARFYLRPEFFYSFLNNFILVNNQPQLNAMSMGGGSMAAAPTVRSYANMDARIYGGETTYGITLNGALSFNGGASYTRGTATPQPGINVRSGNLPEMPPLRGWSALRYARRWAFAELGAIAVNRQGLVSTDLRESPTAGYALLNPKFGFTAGRLSGSFTVENLLNRFYYEHLSYYRDPFSSGVKIPEPGRNVFVQLRYAY